MQPDRIDIDDDQIICGAAEMLLRRHGSSAADMLARRIEALDGEGDLLARAFYKAIAACVSEMDRSWAAH